VVPRPQQGSISQICDRDETGSLRELQLTIWQKVHKELAVWKLEDYCPTLIAYPLDLLLKANTETGPSPASLIRHRSAVRVCSMERKL
jgi:hypothetical protein